MAKKNRKRSEQTAAARTSAAPATTADHMTPAQRVLWYALHALVLLVPLAMSNFSWLGASMPLTFDQFDIAKVFTMRTLTLIALGAWVWHMFAEGGRLRRTPVDWLVLVALGWLALTTITSIHPPTAFFGKYRRYEGLVSFINYATVFFLATQIVDRVTRVRSIARTLFVSGTIVSAYGVMQYLGIDPVRWGNLPFESNRAFSTFGNPDLLGGFIVFVLVISLALALSEPDRTWRIVYWVGFLLTTWCWVVAFTRGAWIGGAVGLMVLVFAAWRHRVRLSGVDYGFLGAITALVGVVVARSLTNPDAVLNVGRRLASIFEFDRGSALTRFQIWEAARAAIADRPIFGFGADTFRLIFPGYKPAEYVQAAGYLSVADNVHNYPLQLAAGIGIPGLLIVYGVFAFAAWRSARSAFVPPADRPGHDCLLLAGVWAACAGYVTHLSFGLSVTGSTIFLWLCMALVLSPVARSVEVRPPRWGAPAALAIIVVIAALLAGNVAYVRADNYHLKGRVLYRNDPTARIQAVERAIALNPFNDMYRAELGMAYLDTFISASQAPDDQLDPETLSGIYEAAERALLNVIDFVPTEYDNYVFLANLYNFGGRIYGIPEYEKAIEIAERGIEVSEHGPAIRVQYALAALALNRTADALEQLEVAVSLDSRYAEAAMLYGRVLTDEGRTEEALAVYRRLEERSPDTLGLQEAIQTLEATLAP